MSAFACTSSNELDELRVKLDEIHVELLQIQKQGATRDEVAEIGDSISGQVDAVATADEETRRELKRLSDRIAGLEGKLDETNFNLAQLAQKLNATQQELQAIRNATELARRQPTPPPQSAPSPQDPQALYDDAYNDYVRGNYDLAILSFRRFLDNYPRNDLADNAAYWIGECYFRQGSYTKSVEQFEELLSRYPDSDLTPSALLREGYAYLELGQSNRGVSKLQQVVCDHASTDEAKLANQRLQTLGLDATCDDP